MVHINATATKNILTGTTGVRDGPDVYADCKLSLPPLSSILPMTLGSSLLYLEDPHDRTSEIKTPGVVAMLEWLQ